MLFRSDLDKDIEQKQGMSIPDMFREYGEEWFRQREMEAVRYWAGQKNVVISTGGGTVKNPANTRLLRQQGRLVCLHADVDTLLERTSRQGKRPVLDARAAEFGGDRRKAIESLLEERKPMYEQADFYVDTGELSPLQVAVKVADYIRREK